MPGTEFTQELAGKFLEALIVSGGRMIKACEEVGISWGQVYRWRRTEPDFATALEDAVAMSTMVLEEEGLRLAIEGDEIVTTGTNGSVTKRIKRYPQLLMFMLEARRPNTYRRSIKVEGLAPRDNRPVLEGVAASARGAYELLQFGQKVERVFDVDDDGKTTPAD